MNWINLRTELLRSPSFASAKPGSIETWLRVLAYCCEQENGGQMSGAAAWNDRAWMTACGVTKAEIEIANPLIYDDGVDVFIEAFPSEKQAEVQAKREAGKKGGRKSAASRASTSASPIRRTEGEGEGEVESERKGKGKGKRNNKGNPRVDDALFPADAFEGLPKSLDSPLFREAWTEYLDYRAARKLPKLIPVSVKERFNEFESWGIEDSILAIHSAIANGHQGIFPPKPNGKKPWSKTVPIKESDMPKVERYE